MSPLPKQFAALGDPTRFAIIERLVRDGELSAGALLEGAEISAPAFSRHLKILRQANLISQRIDKQRRIYTVRPEALAGISDWAISYRQFWGQSLDRLSDILDQKET